jgi:phage host-nuclease inhibitor protein Gam
MAKKTTKPTTIRDREELETVLGEYAKLCIQKEQQTLEMEEKINAIRKRYETELTELTEKAEAFFGDIQAWATLNQAEFETRKSLELIHGVVGFRTCPAAVKQVGGVKVEHTLDMMKQNPGFKPFLREKTELDKEAILAAFGMKQEGLIANLAAVGLKIEQKENFFIELKTEGGEK